MLMLQYTFHLAHGHDMQSVRDRVRSRLAVFDDFPGLTWKAWLLSERGRGGSVDNLYAPLYLFRDAPALARFLAGPIYKGVTDAFGWVRPVSGPVLGHEQGAINGVRACSLRSVPADAHAVLERAAAPVLTLADGELARYRMLDAGQMCVREYRLWSREAADLDDVRSTGAQVYEVEALSRPWAGNAA